MLMLAADTTIRREREIKRSRFIATATRTESAEEAREFIASIRSEFPDARHHCSAFSVTPAHSPNPILHSSDDGEPSGTAGRPMLDVLIGSRISNICVVVTRYFGGTLLGTGGLVRAYSESVRAALQDAPLVQTQQAHVFSVPLPHATAGKFEADIRALSYSVTSVDYEASHALVRCAVTPAQLSAFFDDVAALTAGSSTPIDEGLITHEYPASPLA